MRNLIFSITIFFVFAMNGFSQTYPKPIITYLNAYNFDFNNTLPSNYLGHLRVFVPSQSKYHFKDAVITGIMKINYINTDSVENYLSLSYLRNPLDSIKLGTVFDQKFQHFVTKTQNTQWSLYVQPLFRLNDGADKKGIYFHFHGELLVNKWSSTTEVSTVQSVADTMKTAADLRNVYVAYSLYPHTESKIYYNGYFGAGLTFDSYPLEKTNLFFQATAGWTTNFPNPTSVTGFNVTTNANGTSTKQLGSQLTQNKGAFFYLIRSHIRQELGTNTTVLVGAEIRGLFPMFNPLYSIYAGIAVKLDKLLDVLK